MRIGIVGAGMAGLACAEALAAHRHDVVVFDKGRGPGGRMSTRRVQTPVGEAHFDHGTQFFTAQDPGFQSRIEAWIGEGAVAPWPAAGPGAYVGVPGMNGPVRQMASGLTVHWSSLVTRIEGLATGWRLSLDQADPVEVDLAIVATPAEQARALLAPEAADLAARAGATLSTPCWTLMLAFAEPVGLVQDCWTGPGPVAWAARNSAKPGRVGPETWVVQASPDWSQAHIEDAPETVTAALKTALSNLLDIDLPSPVSESSHRWRYARSGAEGSVAIFDAVRRLGVCGDWLNGPTVEAAWVSGTRLAHLIAATAKV